MRIFSTNVLVIVLVVIGGIILPRLLNPVSLGRLNALLALVTIVYSFTFLGMRSSLVMHLGRAGFEKKDIYRGTAWIFLFSVLLSILSLLFFLFFISTDQYSVWIIVLVCLINPFEFLIGYMQGINLARSNIGRYNRLKWIPGLVYLMAIGLFLGVFQLQVKGALIAAILANLITVLIYLRISKPDLPVFRRGEFPLKAIKSLVSYGSLFALSFLITRLNHKIDILILKRLSDLAEVGYYSLGVNVAEMIWQIPIAVGIILMTQSAVNENQRLVTRQVCSSLRVSMLVVVLASLILFALAPVLVRLAFGERYLPSAGIIRAILPGIVFFVILKIINSQFIGTGKPQLTLLALLPSLLVNIGLNFILIPRYEGIGAAIATNISYFIASLLLVLVYARTFRVPFVEIFRYRSSDFYFLRKIRF
ncbi:MAG: polysaccharide biosynthesis C-terminal domain-containing protein [Bacteroidales bacterium]|nr:polysaccharide biosynthesis C-terminal domain-containing protein [Bacteroidales bacterium]